MKYKDEDIEFANLILIDRKNLDDAEVEMWMKDPEHVEILNEFVVVYQNGMARNFNRNKDRDFIRLKQSMFVRKRRRLLLRWSVAASVAVLVGGAIGLMVNNRQAEETSRMAERTETGVPGMKAELILATGEKIVLNQQDTIIGGTKETGIRNDSSVGLSYAVAKVLDEGTNAGTVSNKMRIPVGGFYRLALADGTKVWLNSVTELQYPVTFTGGQRKVYLSGEAYFEVAHDAQRPFIVHAGGVDVKVYGTEFNVNTYRDGVVQTVLVKGKVGLYVTATGEEQMLKPDQMAEYTRGQSVRVREVDPYAYVAWKEGGFVFEDETIEEIMVRLCRWYDVKVVYVSEKLKQKRFTGVLDRYDTIDKALRLMEGPATLRFEVIGNVVYVKNVE